jgi:hypothetical protein
VQKVLVKVSSKHTAHSLSFLGDFGFLTSLTGFFLTGLLAGERRLRADFGFLQRLVAGFLVCGGTHDFLHLKLAGFRSIPALHFRTHLFVVGFNS